MTSESQFAERLAALCAEAQKSPEAVLGRLSRECLDARARPDGAGLGFATLAYGAALLQTGDGAAALPVLAEARAVAAAADDGPLLVQVAVFQSKALTITGHFQGALECFREGLDVARRVGDRQSEGLLLCSLGVFHGQLEEAVPYEEYTRVALALFREIGDRQRECLCLNNLAGALSRQKRYDEALVYYEEALPIAQALDWRRGLALILGGSGGVRLRQGHVEEGTRRYVESNAILAELGDVFQITRHLGLLGRALVEVGRPREARVHLEAAVRSAEAHHFELELAQALELLSQAHEALGDPSAALSALRHHLRVASNAADRRTEETIRVLKVEHRLAASRREAEHERARSAELAASNSALAESLQRQRVLQEELERLASTDPLTGLYNRRSVQELGGREIARSRRTRRTLAMLVADIDHFKRINDRHGHPVGDQVLMEVAARLRQNVRTVDIVGRWGGEEFCVILVETNAAGALVTAERLRSAMAQRPFQTSAGPLAVTLSIGVADLDGDAEDLSSLLARADAALYIAKGRGRDQAFVATSAG